MKYGHCTYPAIGYPGYCRLINSPRKLPFILAPGSDSVQASDRPASSWAKIIPFSPGSVTMSPRSFHYWAGIAGLAAVYFTTGRLGLMLDPVSGFATLV